MTLPLDLCVLFLLYKTFLLYKSIPKQTHMCLRPPQEPEVVVCAMPHAGEAGGGRAWVQDQLQLLKLKISLAYNETQSQEGKTKRSN